MKKQRHREVKQPVQVLTAIKGRTRDSVQVLLNLGPVPPVSHPKGREMRENWEGTVNGGWASWEAGESCQQRWLGWGGSSEIL